MTRKCLLRILGCVLALGIAFVATVTWKTRPHTIFAPGFSASAFGSVQAGESESDILQRLGRPLRRDTEVTDEEWCFGADSARVDFRWFDWLLNQPSEASCLYFRNGTVDGGRGDWQGRSKQLDGMTPSTVIARLGKPDYSVPAGTKIILRYSGPRRPADSYEAYLVVLDAGGNVRGTQHFVYRD